MSRLLNVYYIFKNRCLSPTNSPLSFLKTRGETDGDRTASTDLHAHSADSILNSRSTDFLKSRVSEQREDYSRLMYRVVLLLVFAVIAAYVVRRFFAALQGVGRERPPAEGRQLVRDPVCGMYVPRETALSARNQFFCSEECRSKFLS